MFEITWVDGIIYVILAIYLSITNYGIAKTVSFIIRSVPFFGEYLPLIRRVTPFY